MSKANTLIQQAADFLRSIMEDPETEAAIREKQVERWHDLQILRRYQAYRRGTGSINDCPSPREISLVLERVIRELKRYFQD